MTLAAPPASTDLRRVELRLTPEQALRAWPRGVPLAALWSGGGGPSARWTVLARAEGETNLDAASLLPRLASPRAQPHDDAPPFAGGWIGCLEYELGAVLEPAARHPDPRALKLSNPRQHVHWLRCDDAIIFDHQLRRWWSVGNPPDLDAAPSTTSFRASPIELTTTRATYERAVQRALDYIRAGDIYQVNLAHHLRASFDGDPRAFFASLARAAQPWYGAYLELGDHVVCSASPELFLSFDPAARTLTTRPMKGTRPAGQTAALLASPKEQAELTMITDLMRNDLGRVCELGSVRISHPREIESHAQLLQATSTIQGTLRSGLTLSDALVAMFPGGSVTGAPKIRAMQIIQELEQTPRGPYCGCIGFLSRSGCAAFNVAIRTATIALAPTGGILDYAAGAGIVADSVPADEWQETLDKVGVLRAALGVNP